MKTIGLIGGTSWFSSIDYYRIINENVNSNIGNNASAKILLYSVNFEEIVTLTKRNDWAGIATIMCKAAKNLELAGADCMLLCANTMHIIADEIQSVLGIPLLHIANMVAEAIEQKKLHHVLLLGTKYTMQSSFYADRLGPKGIKITTPDTDEMEIINNSIYNELGKGLLLPETKKTYLDIINKYIAFGAEAVILGCTEIPLLIKQEDCKVPLLDTTLIHATAAVKFALSETTIKLTL